MSDVPDARALAAELIARLRDENTAPGIEIGEQAPRFVLPDATGGKVALDDRLAAGRVVLSFYRGAWCPHCNTELRAQQLILPEITGLGASLVAVSPQAPDDALSLTQRLELGFDVLSDVDQSTIRAYRLQFTLPDALRPVYSQWGFPLDQQNADGTWDLPVPATFVLDQHGVVRARHVDPDYTKRMEPQAILTALRSLA